MAKRIFDIVCSIFAILILLPLFAVIALGIKLSGKGPVFFKARRVGIKEKCFNMFKFRSMRIQNDNNSIITSANDDRIFPFGHFIRNYKLDELPQLFNILKGDMSVIGPRPEDPKIVKLYYQPIHKVSLNVRPGLASPGSIYNYSHVELDIADTDPEKYYADNVLDTKVMLDVVYTRKQSFFYDLSIVLRTIKIILMKAFGTTTFPYPPEYYEISKIITKD